MLESLLRKYRLVTEKITITVQEDELDDVGGLVREREQIVEEIASGNYEKEVIKNIFMNLNISEAENEMNQILLQKREEIKEEIRKTQENKVAKNKYTTVRSKAIFLSEQI